MKSIKQVVADQIVSPWRHSEKSEADVREQIRARWGDDLAEDFSAAKDAMPHKSWASYNFRVKRGERALKSRTVVEIKNEKDEIVKKICRTVNLFHRRQVEPVKV